MMRNTNLYYNLHYITKSDAIYSEIIWLQGGPLKRREETAAEYITRPDRQARSAKLAKLSLIRAVDYGAAQYAT